MAAMIGLVEISISVSTSCRPGGFGGLPNSVMSAPAIKVRPPQVRTIAFTSGSAMARLMQSKMPPRTAALNAFTGGLSTVTMATTSRRSSLTTSFTGLSLDILFLTNFALRNLIPHLDTEGYFEARRLSTSSAQQQAMKRPGKKVATDRSFVVALSRGLDVLRAFHPKLKKKAVQFKCGRPLANKRHGGSEPIRRRRKVPERIDTQTFNVLGNARRLGLS